MIPSKDVKDANPAVKRPPKKVGTKSKHTNSVTVKVKKILIKPGANRPKIYNKIGVSKETQAPKPLAKKKKGADGSRPSGKASSDRTNAPGVSPKGLKSLPSADESRDIISYYQTFVDPIVYHSYYPSERYAEYASQYVTGILDTKTQKQEEQTDNGVGSEGSSPGNRTKSNEPRLMMRKRSAAAEKKERSKNANAVKLNGTSSLRKRIPNKMKKLPTDPNQFEDADECRPYSFVLDTPPSTNGFAQTMIHNCPSMQDNPGAQQRKNVTVQPLVRASSPHPLSMRHNLSASTSTKPMPLSSGHSTSTSKAVAASTSSSSTGTPIQAHAMSFLHDAHTHGNLIHAAHYLAQVRAPEPPPQQLPLSQGQLQPQLLQTYGNPQNFASSFGVVAANHPSIVQAGIARQQHHLQQWCRCKTLTSTAGYYSLPSEK